MVDGFQNRRGSWTLFKYLRNSSYFASGLNGIWKNITMVHVLTLHYVYSGMYVYLTAAARLPVSGQTSKSVAYARIVSKYIQELIDGASVTR